MHQDEFEGRPELVQKKARADLVNRVSWAVIVSFIILSLVLLLINAVQGAATRDTVVSCTKPGEFCFEQGQERTAKVVEKLIAAGQQGEVTTRMIAIRAAVCSEEPDIKRIKDRAKRIDAVTVCAMAQTQK